MVDRRLAEPYTELPATVARAWSYGLGLLRKPRSLAGDSFRAGIAFYAGTCSCSLECRLRIVAIDRVWR